MEDTERTNRDSLYQPLVSALRYVVPANMGLGSRGDLGLFRAILIWPSRRTNTRNAVILSSVITACPSRKSPIRCHRSKLSMPYQPLNRASSISGRMRSLLHKYVIRMTLARHRRNTCHAHERPLLHSPSHP